MDMNQANILVCDDEVEVADLLKHVLEREGFAVTCCHSGDAALTLLNAQVFDLAILDIMMPGIDGFEVCRRARQFTDIPIIFLSAKDDEADRLVGLHLGADDYVVKPFHVRELIARVKSFLRRRRGEVLSQVASYEIRDLFIDKERFEVRRKKAWISLTPTEFSLLDILASAPDRVFSRMQLLEKAMGGAYYEGAERTIDTHIRNLRKKLEPDPSQPIYIVTVYGVGYKFQGANHEA